MQSWPYRIGAQLQNEVKLRTASVCQTRTNTHTHIHTHTHTHAHTPRRHACRHVRILLNFQGRENNAPLMWENISSAGNAQIMKGLHWELLLINWTASCSTEYCVPGPLAVTVLSRAWVCVFLTFAIIIIHLFIYLLQLGCHPVAVVILHVYKIWNCLLLDLSREGYMRSM